MMPVADTSRLPDSCRQVTQPLARSPRTVAIRTWARRWLFSSRCTRSRRIRSLRLSRCPRSRHRRSSRPHRMGGTEPAAMERSGFLLPSRLLTPAIHRPPGRRFNRSVAHPAAPDVRDRVHGSCTRPCWQQSRPAVNYAVAGRACLISASASRSCSFSACNFSMIGATSDCENRLWMCCGQLASQASSENTMARST